MVVVDNTPDSQPSSVIYDLERMDVCTVIRNHKNLGIATALNIGIRRAIAMGFPWIVTFDQDSQIPSGYVEAMLSGYDEAAEHCRVGMLCPRYRDARLGRLLPTRRANNGDIMDGMTSGSMIQAETFLSFGPMEEDFFIDYVDLEYCLRLRTAGLKIVECPKAVLSHSLGRITEHNFLGRRTSTTNHSAKRRYYITRNRLVVMKRYFSKDREWVIGDFKGMVADMAKIFLLEKDRLAKARYIFQGICDALLGRLGPRVPL